MIAIEMNESNEVLRNKWKGLKDCFKNYQSQAEELSGGRPTDSSTYHKWCWAESVQFLENCGYKCSKSPRVSSVSFHDCSLVSESPPSMQLVSSTSIPAKRKPEILYLESSETLRKDSVPGTRPPTFTQKPQAVQSAQLPEASYKQRSSPTKKSNSNSADDGDRIYSTSAKRGEPSEAIDFLFKSYAETFKCFSAKRQVLLKVKLANLFADAELDEIKEPSVAFSSASVADEHDYAIGTDSHSPDSDISSID